MSKTTSTHSPRRAKGSKAKRKLGAWETTSAVVGLFFIFLGLCDIGHEGNALLWRVKAKLFFVEGQARMEKTEIAIREGAADLDLTYHLEIDGKSYPSTTTREPDDLGNLQKIAEKRQALFVPGQLYRCWYEADRPENNVLAPEGLELGKHVLLLGIPFGFGGLGWLLYRWSARRWKARGVFSETKQEED